jgi:hypothetical protein
MPDEPQEATVFETADVTELQLARNLLEQEGVPFRIDGGSSSSGLLGVVLGANIGGFHAVVVPLEFEERALEIFATTWPEDAAGSEEAGE